MRRVIVGILIVVAIGVYGWNFFYIVSVASKSNTNEESSEARYSAVAEITYVTYDFKPTSRDPFAIPELELVNKKPKVVESQEIKVKEVKPTLPSHKINGIMWNKKKPLAMLRLPSRDVKMVRVGDIVGKDSVKVITIEKKRVQLLYQKQRFWIEK